VDLRPKARAYYFHRFYDFQPDLNMDNPEVRAEVRRTMGFWLQLGVDGFRLDAVPFTLESVEPGEDEGEKHFEYLAEFRRFLQWRSGARSCWARRTCCRRRTRSTSAGMAATACT
jgi:maltose alpha-D-glucosyltransferase / alpha-amylase